MELDNIDKRILRVLQQDGRISIAALSREVGLSSSPCFERIKRLESIGVIQGFEARVNPKYLGRELLVFVQIRLSRTSDDIFKRFTEAVIQLEEVQECNLVSGNFDYLIKARVANMDAYRIFLGETLLQLPGVEESTSYVVMEQVKESLLISI